LGIIRKKLVKTGIGRKKKLMVNSKAEKIIRHLRDCQFRAGRKIRGRQIGVSLKSRERERKKLLYAHFLCR
jgi:hypothetical protein